MQQRVHIFQLIKKACTHIPVNRVYMEVNKVYKKPTILRKQKIAINCELTISLEANVKV